MTRHVFCLTAFTPCARPQRAVTAAARLSTGFALNYRHSGLVKVGKRAHGDYTVAHHLVAGGVAVIGQRVSDVKRACLGKLGEEYHICAAQSAEKRPRVGIGFVYGRRRGDHKPRVIGGICPAFPGAASVRFVPYLIVAHAPAKVGDKRAHIGDPCVKRLLREQGRAAHRAVSLRGLLVVKLVAVHYVHPGYHAVGDKPVDYRVKP